VITPAGSGRRGITGRAFRHLMLASRLSNRPITFLEFAYMEALRCA
jgi:hypothetical protein